MQPRWLRFLELFNSKKNIMRKHTAIIILFIVFLGTSLSGYSQNVVAQRIPANEKSIPLIVSGTFKMQYPTSILRGWYVTHLTYWQNDYSSDWYYGWYGQRTVVVYGYQQANYFEVEFSLDPGELSRAIYNIYGHWYETRTQIKGLTVDIHKALDNSKYADWKLSSIMEKLDSPAWPVEIYRFQVSKGLRSRIIRMDADGNIIQIRDIND